MMSGGGGALDEDYVIGIKWVDPRLPMADRRIDPTVRCTAKLRYECAPKTCNVCKWAKR
jgi:hypothetical protein